MERVYVERPLASGASVALPPAAAHHVAHVLRLRRGADVTLFDGRGGEFEAIITRADRRGVEVRVGRKHGVDRESSLPLVLVQGISRAKRMDIAIQKAVELGVTTFVPVLTERSVVRLDAEGVAARSVHWRGIAIHACEQCGRTRLPEIADVTTLGEWLDHVQPAGRKLVLNPRASRGLDTFTRGSGPITLMVGPEGGFTPAEVAAAEAAGFTSVAFGPRILRTETAAIAGLTAIQLLWGDLGGGGAAGTSVRD